MEQETAERKMFRFVNLERTDAAVHTANHIPEEVQSICSRVAHFRSYVHCFMLDTRSRTLHVWYNRGAFDRWL